VVAAAVASVEAMMPKRSLSLSLLADESHQAAIVRLVHSCTVHLLRIISICCTRHADDMQVGAISTFCNLLQSITVTGYLSDSGKLSLATVSVVDVWNSLSEAIVKSSSVNSFKNNLCNADLSKFLTVV